MRSVVLVLLVACSSSPAAFGLDGPNDAGHDAAAPHDAGHLEDVAASSDASTLDAQAEPDAEPVLDAAPPPSDAWAPDAADAAPPVDTSYCRINAISTSVACGNGLGFRVNIDGGGSDNCGNVKPHCPVDAVSCEAWVANVYYTGGVCKP